MYFQEIIIYNKSLSAQDQKNIARNQFKTFDKQS
jgi:hypothetical protein